MAKRSAAMWAVWTAGVLAIYLAGCGGAGSFGESVRVAPEKRMTLESPFAGGRPMYFPKDRPLNITDAQRSSTGSGAAESWARETGTALCKASADSPGKATAEFQLGQVLDTRSDKPVDVTAVFDLDYQYSVKSDPDDTTKPEDKLALKVYISDSNRHVLKRTILTDLQSASAPDSFAGREKPSFDVTLEPGLAYHFVVAGLVEVSGTEKSGASAGIEIRSFELELLPRNTPP
jgi:hypothetical protein